MTLEFLSPDLAERWNGRPPVARSPLDAELTAAGASFEERWGWRVATGFGDPAGEAQACGSSVGVVDRSHLGKVEVQGPDAAMPALVEAASGGARLELGAAANLSGAWWCPVTAERVLVLCEPGRTAAVRKRLDAAAREQAGAVVVDLTSALAAMAIVGPRSREALARLTALDLRERETPEGGFRPGSVARVPAMVLRERGDRFVVLFGAAHARYMWTAAIDAAEPLGGRAVGAAALEGLTPQAEAATQTHA